MIGNIGIYISLIGAIVAAAAFFISSSSGNKSVLKYSRFCFYLHTLGLVVSSIYLLVALLTHRFQYFYVYAHTEQTLELKYLISAFWAGQEGTILLWALLGAIIGLFIMKWEQQFEAPVMTFVAVCQAFLLLFLAVQSPFRLMSPIPLEGAGLNPLLQDPWMVIHPPVVFIGYALLFVPFALALAGLWRRDYHGWVLRALPWALVGWATLGAGIFIGGYWAYRVLGWGGYWSWDPVENASLVPWLTASAMIHGYLVQKRYQILAQTNIFLSIITFIFILYATFLTRSGVLADFSVHSFAQTPLTSYLIAFILFFLVIGLALFFARFGEIPTGQNENGISRATLIVYGLTVLVASAVLISLGTSSPVLTTLWGAPSSVDQSYYLMTNTPVAIVISLLLAAIPFLSWKREPLNVVLNRALPFFIGAAIATVGAALIGILSPVSLLYIAAAAFALLSSVYELYHCFRSRGVKSSGGHIAHTGVALTLIGIIASMSYSQSEIVTLTKGARQTAMGYTLTYEQKVFDEEKEQDIFEINITDGKKTFTATPRMYLAGREPRLMRKPSVKRYLWGDLYISPIEEQQKKPGIVMGFTPGESRVVRGMEVTFLGFELTEHESMEDVTAVDALLEVRFGDVTEIIAPGFSGEGAELSHEPSSTPDGGEVILEGVHPDEGLAHLRFISPYDSHISREILFVDISFNPLILVLALGTVLIMGGTIIAAWRRFTEAKDLKKGCR